MSSRLHTRRPLLSSIVLPMIVAALILSGCSTSDEGTATINEEDLYPLGMGKSELYDDARAGSDWDTEKFGAPFTYRVRDLSLVVKQSKDTIAGERVPLGAAVDSPIMWQRVQCFILPFSNTAGPIVDQYKTGWTGFAHTPLGAALAGIHISSAVFTIYSQKDNLPKLLAKADTERIMSNPDLRFLDFHGWNNRSCAATRKEHVVPKRYRVVGYTDDAATIEYWVPTDDGGGVAEATLVWEKGEPVPYAPNQDGMNWRLTEVGARNMGYFSQSILLAPMPEEPLDWEPLW